MNNKITYRENYTTEDGIKISIWGNVEFYQAMIVPATSASLGASLTVDRIKKFLVI